jgi:hypothetical protein
VIRRYGTKFQARNPNSQTNLNDEKDKIQSADSPFGAGSPEHWHLELRICLVFRAWCFRCGFAALGQYAAVPKFFGRAKRESGDRSPHSKTDYKAA